MSKFTENQVIYIINLWKTDFLSLNIKSNTDKYNKMSKDFNKKFIANISDVQIKNKIKYLKKKYSEVSIISMYIR